MPGTQIAFPVRRGGFSKYRVHLIINKFSWWGARGARRNAFRRTGRRCYLEVNQRQVARGRKWGCCLEGGRGEIKEMGKRGWGKKGGPETRSPTARVRVATMEWWNPFDDLSAELRVSLRTIELRAASKYRAESWAKETSQETRQGQTIAREGPFYIW